MTKAEQLLPQRQQQTQNDNTITTTTTTTTQRKRRLHISCKIRHDSKRQRCRTTVVEEPRTNSTGRKVVLPNCQPRPSGDTSSLLSRASIVTPSPLRSPPPPITPTHQTNANESRFGSSFFAPVLPRNVSVFQKIDIVGQGTYGSVFACKDKQTGAKVALKRINTEREKNGFPMTAIREMKILKALNHPNAIRMKEIVSSEDEYGIPRCFFLVFDFCEYDLTGILETPKEEIALTADHIKSWTRQLLMGVLYIHTNKIMHRDLKTSNILISKTGQLKIADWGLARNFNDGILEQRRLTKNVCTLWYRAPELLLDCNQYTTKIDLWSIGCIVTELFSRKAGFFRGKTDATQLELIIQELGHPTLQDWPDIQQTCKKWNMALQDTEAAPPASSESSPTIYKRNNNLESTIKSMSPNPEWVTNSAMDLIHHLLKYNPTSRWSAREALNADYFFESPIVKNHEELDMNFSIPQVHEWACRVKRAEQRAKMEKSKMEEASRRMSRWCKGG